VNYHGLNDFRAENAQWLTSCSVTTWRAGAIGVITLQRVAHDGVRVRPTLGGELQAARALGKQLKLPATGANAQQQTQDDPGGASRREQAARDSAAQRRERRIEAALARLPEIEQAKRRNAAKARTRGRAHRRPGQRHEDG